MTASDPVRSLTNERLLRTATVTNWEPPEAEVVPHHEHVRRLVRGLQEARMTGVVPAWRILRVYPELCWSLGLVPLAEKDLLEGLSQTCKRARRDVKKADGTIGRLTTYAIPEPKIAPTPFTLVA